MDFPVSAITTFTESLTNLNYPNMFNSNEMEIRKIFSQENRMHFLTWALNKLTTNYATPIELAKQSNKLGLYLSEAIYKNGFCKLSEKNSFVSSPETMKSEQQLPIFRRIFKVLLLTKPCESDKGNVEQKPKNLEECINLMNLYEINIFPEYGPVTVMLGKRQSKIDKYKEDIEELNIKIAESEKCRDELVESIQNIKKEKPNNKEIEEKNKELLSEITKFKEQFPDLNINTLESEVDNSNIGELATECTSILSKVLKIMENKVCVSQYLQSVPHDKFVDDSDDFVEFYMHNYPFLNQILSNQHDSADD